MSYDPETFTVTIGESKFIMSAVIDVYRDGKQIILQYLNGEIRTMDSDMDNSLLEKIVSHRLRIEIRDQNVVQIFGTNNILIKIPIAKIVRYEKYNVGAIIILRNGIYITMFGINAPEITIPKQSEDRKTPPAEENTDDEELETVEVETPKLRTVDYICSSTDPEFEPVHFDTQNSDIDLCVVTKVPATRKRQRLEIDLTIDE